MSKEKSDKQLTVMLQPSLHEIFETKCEEDYRTVSEVVRELISKHIKGWVQVPKLESKVI